MVDRVAERAVDYAGAIAEHLEGTGLRDMPEAAIARAKQRLIDSLGNVLAGVHATGNAAARAAFAGYGGRPEATAAGVEERLPAPHAALLNAMAMRSYDFEAVGAEAADASMVAAHISGTTVPVALAAAERAGRDGTAFLEALILGEDLASRLAVASGFHTASGGDNTGTVNVMGGAAIVGRLEGFTQRQYRDALGHALNQMAGTVQNLFDKADSFKLPQSLAARNAIVAADLAKCGFGGLDDALGAAFGFFRLFSPAPRPEALLEGLGRSFYADMIIKPWASCRAAHPALDAVLRLRSGHGLTPDDIERVEIHVTPTTKRGFTGQRFADDPRSEVDGLFSIPYNVAVGLIEGTVRPEHLDVAYMARPDVRELLERVELVDSLPPDEYQTAEAVVLTRDGRRLHQRVEDPLGDIYRNPLSDAAVRDKFRRNIEFAGREERVGDELIAAVERVEDLDDLTPITSLLAAR
ncbi:MmgE/PrpD family protein [Microbacterium album]|uniref:2-methylcitrate dehydratase n=1 Tax=Microbacterium album TaxID=2053191 RepID=A0A917MNN4_9MICO|nr:MmgE/PrpD family protein [Microbacterium album]GGH42377.1 2-methylcitrate dehydratase [Microbacterium album]